ncbi:hypothetical protein E4U60_006580 [Claviceps pazoutovae]|uniref:Uncharacterized protein n=1 Tax=Claviceps pazoutovae TaxID=1649127 RepID=A0A9P7MGT2_9HYPO|nr:hypothetical protein E4U60_006580 [Claviceps pazoutovae]
MHALSLLALLLPLAAGNKHYQCDCMSWTAGPGQNWIHDATLSHYVCFQYYGKDGVWNANQGLCVAKPGFKFDGQSWENNCKDAISGYYPVVTDDYNNELLDKTKKIVAGAATGWCPDKLE